METESQDTKIQGDFEARKEDISWNLKLYSEGKRLTLTTRRGYVITVAPSFAIAPSRNTWCAQSQLVRKLGCTSSESSLRPDPVNWEENPQD